LKLAFKAITREFLFEEESMRKLSAVTVAVILGIALYFTWSWGSDALRMLASPAYGLDDVWRSQFIFVIGGLFGLAPLGLIKLAAFLATLKLAAAVICAVHILDRLRALIGGKANTDILEAGLILIVAISIASVGPAVWSHNAELVREHTIQLLLAAIATALCIVERSYGRNDEVAALTAADAGPPQSATRFML
jgi:ABC-type uncharacterized transport system permease subunit